MFFVGTDSFEFLEIRQSPTNERFYYFFNVLGEELVKSFVLKVKPRTRIECQVTLILQESGKLSPRLELTVRNSTTQALASIDVPIVQGETRTIKARVDLGECNEEFWQLIRFLEHLDEVEIPSSLMTVVSAEDAHLVEAIKGWSKEARVAAIQTLAVGLDERDIALLSNRKSALDKFKELLDDRRYFEAESISSGDRIGNEGVWQEFFEENPWIFGYGLRLVSCEGLDNSALQSIVAGNDVFSGAGKRIDALMKTRSRVSGLLFCEIKTPSARLLQPSEYRVGVYAPAEDLRGGIAQVQKTIHKVVLMVTETHREITDTSGEPSGEVVTFVQPRGVLVVGRLSEFINEDGGVNYERFSSFELLRQSLHGLEVITFDELYDRACFIVSHTLGEESATAHDDGLNEIEVGP